LMTLFFLDLNVWMALSVKGHVHHTCAWRWMDLVGRANRLVFSRYTQLGLLRLLSNDRVMGDQVLTMAEAWDVYDRWIDDPRVEWHPEPHGVEAALRQTTGAFSGQPAPKWIGDCYLLSFAKEIEGTLVTFDQALYQFALRNAFAAISPL